LFEETESRRCRVAHSLPFVACDGVASAPELLNCIREII
jgi:hypothetical protein